MSGDTGQQVPKGYRQTEVGVVPSDWDIISIDRAITERIILDQMDGNHGELYPKSHEFSDSGVPYVGATDFDDGKIDFKDCKYIPEKRAALFKKGIAKNGDVLFAHNATVGPVAMVETELDYIILSTTATYYRCDNKTLLNRYLKAYFESEYFVGQYVAVMSQSTRNQVPILAQRKFNLVLPRFEEQTAIANALSDVDALITSLEKLIAKKRAIKTAAMQQLLTGKKRLPPFDTQATKNGTPAYKQTELGEIPADWEVVSLGDIGQSIIGLTYSPNDVVDHGTLVLRSSNVQNNKLAYDNNVFVEMELPERILVKEGDILVCVRNGSKKLIGKCAIIDKKAEGVAFGAFMSVYRTESSNFIFYQFQSNIIQRQIDEIMGATINQITNKDMAVFKVPFPNNKEERTAIANVLSDFDKELGGLECQLNKTQQLKQGMMQELLTGKTRLVKPEEG